MKTYQAFSKTEQSQPLVNTEIKAMNIKEARAWFKNNTIENETVFLKSDR